MIYNIKPDEIYHLAAQSQEWLLATIKAKMVTMGGPRRHLQRAALLSSQWGATQVHDLLSFTTNPLNI